MGEALRHRGGKGELPRRLLSGPIESINGSDRVPVSMVRAVTGYPLFLDTPGSSAGSHQDCLYQTN